MNTVLNGGYQHNHGNCDKYGGTRVCALSVARNLLCTCLERNKRLLSLIESSGKSIIVVSLYIIQTKGHEQTRKSRLLNNSDIALVQLFHCSILNNVAGIFSERFLI